MATCVLALASLPTAATATEALSFTGGGLSFSAQTRGFSFTLAKAATITGLGWWDLDGDGLAVSHQVAIWTTAGRELVGGTVASGTADAIVDGFRYTDALTGSSLLVGGTYVIGGLSNGMDRLVSGVAPANLTTASGVTFVENRTNGDGGVFSFAFRAQSGLDIGMFGPNFQFTMVPEPASWALMIGGFAVTGVAARRRRAATA